MIVTPTAVIPPRISPGQTLGVIAPAGPVDLERLKRGLDRLGDVFRIRVADGIYAPRADNVPDYLAASDAARIAELEVMIADPDVRAIVLARGGYGLMRILPQLDPSLLARDPKPIVGFSDATALLAWTYAAANVRGIHGPMIQQLGDLPDEQVAHLIALLTEARAPGTRPWQLASSGTGQHAGHLVAANLTLASMLVGTPWALPLASSVALFEEIGEKPYELDRYVMQLALTNAIAETRAIVVGELVRCYPINEPDGNALAMAALLERFAAIGKPVATGAPVGHGTINEALPFGARCELDLDAKTFAILEPAVH